MNHITASLEYISKHSV